MRASIRHLHRDDHRISTHGSSRSFQHTRESLEGRWVLAASGFKVINVVSDEANVAQLQEA
jgi:hypothetical protein